jgi:hypothetical protein
MSSEIFKGFVVKIFTSESKPGAKRAWTAYSTKLMDENGVELEPYFQLGFDKPAFAAGAYIQVEAERVSETAHRLVEGGDHKVIDPSHAPKTPEPAADSSAKGSSKASGGGGKNSYWEAKEVYDREVVSPRITFSGSQARALELLKVLFESDALPITKTAGKANKAKRFEEIMAVYDKLTVRLYNDAWSQRVLEYVQDETVHVAGDGDLPDQEEIDDAGERTTVDLPSPTDDSPEPQSDIPF